MELYYRDLISKESSLEQLVDELMLVVQGADELVQVAGAKLSEHEKRELTTRLEHLKAGFQRFRQGAVSGAHKADQVMRRYPYSTAGFAFAIGFLAASCLYRKR